MRKFTLIIASLFIAIGAMAQTFVQPEVGKYYKIKGDNSQYPWLMGVQKSGGSGVAVSANEADAAIFEKTENGLKVYGTDTYLYYSGSGDVTIGNSESAVTIGDYNNSTDNGVKYSVKVAGAYMYNNNTDQQVHTSGTFLTNLERFWGFIEVNMGGEDDDKLVADGVYLIKNNYNNRGAMAYGTWNSAEYFGLTEITLSGCTNNNLTVDPVSNKYWYVKTTDKGVYIYNIGKGVFLQERASEKATCAADIANGFTLVERTANNTKYVSVKSGNYYLSYSCGWAPNSNYGSVRWLTSDEAAATLMTFTTVDATAYATEIATADALIAAFESDNEAAKAALGEAIAQAEALLDVIKIGDGVGEYSGGGYTKEELVSLLGSAKEFYNSINASTPVETIEAYIEFVNGTMASYTLNMPEAGKYYRIKAVAGWNDDAPYLTSTNTTVSGKTTRAAFVANADVNSIFYFDGTQLVSYASGHYLVKDNSNMLGYNGVQTAGSKIGFRVATNGLLGAYNISFDNGNRYLYVNQSNYTDAAGTSITDANGYCFNLESVTELPVTVTAAGYATFYAPVAVTVPAGVTAHTVTINGEWATLSEALTVVPAETGVVLVAGEGSHSLAITTTDATAASALVGTTAATYIAADAYVLSNGANGVGFYGAILNQQGNTAFLNNSHKAYLPATAANGAASYSFRFGEGTTGIENVEVENASNVIFDLTGRQVEAISAPGIYIINGKKVLVK